MPDDWYNPMQLGQDFNTCVAKIQHKLSEFVTDPGSREYSASRFGLLWWDGVGAVIAVALTIAGIKFNMSWCGIAISAILTTAFTAHAGVYYASTKKGYRCNCEGNGN